VTSSARWTARPRRRLASGLRRGLEHLRGSAFPTVVVHDYGSGLPQAGERCRNRLRPEDDRAARRRHSTSRRSPATARASPCASGFALRRPRRPDAKPPNPADSTVEFRPRGRTSTMKRRRSALLSGEVRLSCSCARGRLARELVRCVRCGAVPSSCASEPGMRILERASAFRKAHQGALDCAALITSAADQLSAPSEGTEKCSGQFSSSRSSSSSSWPSLAAGASRAEATARERKKLEPSEVLAHEAVAFAAESGLLDSRGDALTDMAEILVVRCATGDRPCAAVQSVG
jgi:hypothetical protein